MIGGAKGIGLGIDLGLVNQYNRTGSQSYIEPEVLDSLVGVWSAYGMTNDSPNRSTIKNKLSNKGGDFVISNAAYDKMSSYGGYEFAKFDNTLDWYNTEGNDSVEVVSRNGHSITLKRLTGPNFWYFQNSTFRGLISNVIPFKVNSNKNITVIWDVHGLSISEGKDKSVRIQELVLNPNEDNYTNLKTLNEEELAQIDISTNSLYYLLWFDLSTLAVDEEVTIEMLPLFEGAFVTDGIDDLITSTKTVQEMLGGSNEITVVSMIHKLSLDNNWTNLIGELKEDHTFVANRGINTDKTGIYGYTYNYKENAIVINNILGDKNDYIVRTSTSLGLDNKYYVTGFKSAGIIQNVSQLAWYWTFIANRVLTTDEINQVIAYYNLDRTLKPDILCNTIKQGITNENHAEFGDKLIDFSGNGRDIQLNNIAWKGDSGIGKYETDFTKWLLDLVVDITIKYSSFNIKTKNDSIVNSWVVRVQDTVAPSMKIKVTGISSSVESLIYRYSIVGDTDYYIDITSDGIYELPQTDGKSWEGFRVIGKNFNISVEQIPSHAGALCLDGVNDFGKVTGMPIYKDYTFIIDRQIIFIGDTAGVVASKSEDSADETKHGAFIFEYLGAPDKISTWSFYKDNGQVANTDFTRGISYQSKYSYNGKDLTVGTSKDSDKLWLGTIRDNDSRFFNGAIYSLMSFPYSMSKFLIERQLKKHKLGTLYPDMVEFRPVIKTNTEWKYLEIYQGDNRLYNLSEHDDKTGIYLEENSSIGIYVKPYTGQKVSKIVYNGTSYIDLENNDYGYYYITVPVTKSPQKIGITIEQDENYVQWNPVVESNVEYQIVDCHIDTIPAIVGKYYPINSKLRVAITTKGAVDEVTQVTVGGVPLELKSNIGNRFTFDGTLSNISPQKINITIDEYIRYEDIVQPYPILLRFNDENGNEVSWGGKFKVGSTITRIGSIDNPERNLLNGLYSVSGLSLNGKAVTSSTSIVEKQMVFKTTTTYLLDNNEPKCILSPSRLRIPNSSYKLLGYIPDISGHGNHGVIHNSAYAEGSGVNEDGSYQFDGVDDHITIPTLSSGGKQVLMKVNLPRLNEIIYDQRKETSTYTFAIVTIPSQIAYDQRNSERITYIDGILNTNIIAEQLMGVTHNIVVINSKANLDNTRSPILGRDINGNNWSRMRIYDFMLFDDISTDDKILELNEYVGIEGNTE